MVTNVTAHTWRQKNITKPCNKYIAVIKCEPTLIFTKSDFTGQTTLLPFKRHMALWRWATSEVPSVHLLIKSTDFNWPCRILTCECATRSGVLVAEVGDDVVEDDGLPVVEGSFLLESRIESDMAVFNDWNENKSDGFNKKDARFFSVYLGMPLIFTAL